MAVTTRQDFLAASHDSLAQRGTTYTTLLLRRATVRLRAADERRVLAQVEPRLLTDAGLERFGKKDL